MAIKEKKSDTLQIENLIKAAFLRTKDRFIGYFLIHLLSFLVTFGFILVVVLIGVGVGFMLQKNIPFLIFIETLLAIGLIAGLVYVGSWMQLAVIKVLTSEEKEGAMETIKEVKPLVGNFMGFIVLNSLFLFGLLPFGILSFFIIYVLWSIWSAFSVFVYLDYQKKGLQNLWVSRNIINKNFWGILGRIILVSWGIGLIFILINAYSKDNGLIPILSVILSLFSGPFILSYTYEIYMHYRENIDVKTPPIWFALSVIGGLMMILGVVYGIVQIPKEVPVLLKQLQNYTPTPPLKPSGIPIPSGYENI